MDPFSAGTGVAPAEARGIPARARDLLGLAFRVSRVRFWLYLGGTYLVGYALGARSFGSLASPVFIAFLLYFLFPANVLLYGINDLFDRDTDRFNAKKGTKEYRMVRQDARDLVALVAVSGVVSVLLLALAGDWPERFLLGAFLFLAVFYSATPLRFKARPVLDFASNFLYGLPGILAYYQATGRWMPWPAILAIFLWTAAMHLFSAVPDIDADRKAGLRTTAVALGLRASLLLCLGLWLAFAVLAALVVQVFPPWGLGAFLYPIVAAATLALRGPALERVYWSFPYLNALSGFALFALAMAPEFLRLVT